MLCSSQAFSRLLLPRGFRSRSYYSLHLQMRTLRTREVKLTLKKYILDSHTPTHVCQLPQNNWSKSTGFFFPLPSFLLLLQFLQQYYCFMKIFACYLKINQYRKAQIIKSSSLLRKESINIGWKVFQMLLNKHTHPVGVGWHIGRRQKKGCNYLYE